MSTPNTHEGASRINAYLKHCAEQQAPVFFIGIGGVMMSSLALLTRRAGHPTAGSDRTHTAITDQPRHGDRQSLLFNSKGSHTPVKFGFDLFHAWGLPADRSIEIKKDICC